MDSKKKPRKKIVIDRQKAKEFMAKLNDEYVPAFSLRDFINEHFDELINKGRSIKELHSLLLAGDIDVGGFTYFCKIFKEEKERRKALQESLGTETLI